MISSSAGASVVWEVHDHPSLALGNPTYMLRLGTNAAPINTFTVDVPGAWATFEFDPMDPTKAILKGLIQHNRGPTTGGFYDIEATFQTVDFESGATSWYGMNPTNAVYDDMLADLFAGSDETDINDTTHRTDLDRIYFETFSMSLMHASGPDSFAPLPLNWDEFPNLPDDKFFYIQKNHRTTTDVLVGVGWLEVTGGTREQTSDFNFTLQQIPTPSALILLGIGLGALGIFRRRDR